MTRHEIARVACRLMALYFMLQAIVSIGVLVLWFASAFAPGSSMYRMNISGTVASIIPPAMVGGIGLWLWKKSDWMASRMLDDRSSSAVGFDVGFETPAPQIPIALPSDRSEVVHIPLSAKEWTVIGFMVAGVFVFVDGIHVLIGIAYTAFMDYRTYQSVRHLEANPVIAAVSKTAIGLWLLFGSRAIVGMVRGPRGKYADPPVVEPRQHDL